jgi:hypothetical protein
LKHLSIKYLTTSLRFHKDFHFLYNLLCKQVHREKIIIIERHNGLVRLWQYKTNKLMRSKFRNILGLLFSQAFHICCCLTCFSLLLCLSKSNDTRLYWLGSEGVFERERDFVCLDFFSSSGNWIRVWVDLLSQVLRFKHVLHDPHYNRLI